MLRFLHDRSQARKSDWRSRLRQRSVRCGIASRRHRDDRAAPIQSQQARYTRWTPAAAIRKAVGGRALLRMGSMAASDTRPMGVLPTKLPRLRLTRLLGNSLLEIF